MSILYFCLVDGFIHDKSSSHNVVLTFNASLIIIAPLSPISFAVHDKWHVLLIILSFFLSKFNYTSKSMCPMMYWPLKLLRSSSLLHLQFYYLFCLICECNPPLQKKMKNYYGPLSHKTINEVLTFNDSLMYIAPSSPRLLLFDILSLKQII